MTATGIEEGSKVAIFSRCQGELKEKSRDEALLHITAADNNLIAMAEGIITIDNPDAWAIDVADHLLKAGQPREVLNWLWSTDVLRHERERKADLRIAAYEQVGRQDMAQLAIHLPREQLLTWIFRSNYPATDKAWKLLSIVASTLCPRNNGSAANERPPQSVHPQWASCNRSAP